MKDWLRTNPLLALTGLAGLILAVVIGLEFTFGASVQNALGDGERRRAVPAEAKLLPSLVAIGPEQAYPETVARPLFIPTRRPAPEAPVTGQTTLSRGQYVLQGTIVVGETRVAMLREKSTGKIHRIESGKDFNGMKVVSIEKEAVTLGVGGDEEKLVLNVLKPTGPAPAAAAGPFAPAVPPAPAGGMPVPGQPVASNPGVPLANTKAGANPSAAPMPQTPAVAAPQSADEALARRRAARRNQQQGN